MSPTHLSLSARRRSPILAALLAVSLLLAACSASTPQPTATPAPTDTPAPTQTPAPTNTPQPTDTPEPTATATPNVTATAAAQATADMASTYALIEPDLKELGFSTSEGHLGYLLTEPRKVTVTTYQGEDYFWTSDQPVGDFVMRAEVQWNTSSGLAGCAILFRAEEDIVKGAHYMFPLMRLQNAPMYDLEYHKYGQWQETLTFGKTQFTGAINDKQDSTNTIALVAQGENITPYINGEKMRSLPNSKLTQGLIGWGTFQESGTTTCTYQSGWVWILK